jgi:hypothetical protein
MRRFVTVIGFIAVVANAALLGFQVGRIPAPAPVVAQAVQEKTPTSRIISSDWQFPADMKDGDIVNLEPVPKVGSGPITRANEPDYFRAASDARSKGRMSGDFRVGHAEPIPPEEIADEKAHPDRVRALDGTLILPSVNDSPERIAAFNKANEEEYQKELSRRASGRSGARPIVPGVDNGESVARERQ